MKPSTTARHMFKTHLLAALLALALVGGIIGIGLFRFNARDLKSYQRLVEKSAPQKKGALISYSQQMRHNVSKEVWFRDDDPLHLHIHARDSELFFFQDDARKTIEVVEEMHSIRCAMQEELFYLLPDGREVVKNENGCFFLKRKDSSEPKVAIDPLTSGLIPVQYLRYFEAEKASYNYNSQLFVAQSVKLWKYRMPGHTLPLSLAGQTPLMSGTAQSVEFLLKGEKMNFTAHVLKATFDPRKGAV